MVKYSHMAISPEDGFLLESLKGKSQLRLNFNHDTFAWEYFWDRVKAERVESLVYHCLKRQKIWPDLPEEIKGRLERSYYRLARDNIILSREASLLLNSFSRAKIDLILLRGLPLAQELYGSIALRSSSDIDLLVRPGDFNLAKETLNSLGFLNSAIHPEEFRKDNLEIDLHWHLTTVRLKSRLKVFDRIMKNIWERARFMAVEGKEVKVPGAQDSLLYLTLHLSLHHGSCGLKWLVDIGRLAERYGQEIDWAVFVKEVVDNGLRWPVYFPLFMASALLEADIPDPVLKGLRPGGANLFRPCLEKMFLSNRPGEKLKLFLTMLTLPGLAKINFLAELILPSRDTLRSLYYLQPSRPLWPFYFRHWQRIIASVF